MNAENSICRLSSDFATIEKRSNGRSAAWGFIKRKMGGGGGGGELFKFISFPPPPQPPKLPRPSHLSHRHLRLPHRHQASLPSPCPCTDTEPPQLQCASVITSELRFSRVMPLPSLAARAHPCPGFLSHCRRLPVPCSDPVQC